jgi:hypothetical protein
VVSLLDTWPEEYSDEPYRSYARILDEQPNPPRTVSYREVLKAQFRSGMVLGVVGLGAVGSVFFAILILTAHYDALRTLIYGVFLVGSGIFLVSFPFLVSRGMTRILRYGVRAEAHLVSTRGSAQYFKAKVRFNLGGEAVEREAPASLHSDWLKDVSPKDLVEVLVDPKSGVPRLFLRVKHRDPPDVGDRSSRSYPPGRNQPKEPEETPPGRRGCLGGGCCSYAFMLGLAIAFSVLAVAILGFIFAVFSPRGTEEGRRAVESLSLILLLVGAGALLLLAVPYIILAILSRRKR